MGDINGLNNESQRSVLEKLQIEKGKEQEQIRTMMEKETKVLKLQRETKLLRKEQKKIESSRVWKYIVLLRKLQSLSANVTKLFSINRKNRNLQEENSLLAHELELTKAKLKEVQQKQDLLTGIQDKGDRQFLHILKQAKADGTLLDDLDALINQKRSQEHRYNEAFQYAARLYQKEKLEYKNYIYNKVLSGLKLEDIPEFIIRAAENEDAVSLQEKSSFQANLNIRARKRQLGASLPEWILENKVDAYSFVDVLNIKRPWVSEVSYHTSNLPYKEDVVIKPVNGAGSRGVYLVFESENILDVKREKTLYSWDDLITSMKEDLQSGWVREDEWILEEIIYEEKQKKQPARDLKFYCFYGKVALILEIQRQPELRYCWWTADRKRISTGKYDEELFKGIGVTQQEIDLAASISLEIPSPFIRIDFLKAENDLVFGEFTPKPGNYDEFDEQTDQWLGEHFLRSENRLANDMLDGKKFEHYKELILNIQATK